MTKRILLCLCIIVMTVSCINEPLVSINVNDRFSGSYKCISAMWQGKPIDIDGDMVAASDLLSEFADFKNIYFITDEAGVVYDINKLNDCGTISLRIPLQAISSYIDPNLPYLKNLITPYITFQYRVDLSGNIIISNAVDYGDVMRHIDIYSKDNLHFSEISSASLSIIDERIHLKVKIGYWDYITCAYCFEYVVMIYERK